MLDTLARFSIAAQLRVAVALTLVVCILVAVFPESHLLPFHQLLQTSRSVIVATQATRWLSICGALACASVLVVWATFGRKVSLEVASVNFWSNRAFWFSVLGLAIGMRLMMMLSLPELELRSDALWYHKAAVAIASGEGLQPYGTPTAYRPPGYSTLLALTYRLLGSNAEWAWFWGSVSTAVILLATYCIAHKLYGKIVARIATLIIALYPALVFYTAVPMSDLVFTAGLMLVWYVVILHPPYRWLETVGIGVALGLITLTRSVSIGLFLVVPAIWFIKQANILKVLLHSVILSVAFVACLVPWIMRNNAIFGAPLLTTNMGLSFYIGNHVNASGTCDTICNQPPSPMSGLTGPANEVYANYFYLKQAMHFVSSAPLDALLSIPKKIVHLFLLEVHAAQVLLQDASPLLKYSAYGIAQLVYWSIALVFLIRLINLPVPALRPIGMQWSGFLIIVYFILVAAVFFGLDRYRLPLLPWMIIESSVIIAWLAYSPGITDARKRDIDTQPSQSWLGALKREASD